MDDLQVGDWVQIGEGNLSGVVVPIACIGNIDNPVYDSLPYAVVYQRDGHEPEHLFCGREKLAPLPKENATLYRLAYPELVDYMHSDYFRNSIPVVSSKQSTHDNTE